MIREHWEAVEDRTRDRIGELREMALPESRRLTERQQFERYQRYGPKDFRAMQRWLVESKGSEDAAQKEFDRYVTTMERYRRKYARP